MEYTVRFERIYEAPYCFLFEHSGYVSLALEDYPMEHWNSELVQVVWE
jgi:hypothetical protein